MTGSPWFDGPPARQVAALVWVLASLASLALWPFSSGLVYVITGADPTWLARCAVCLSPWLVAIPLVAAGEGRRLGVQVDRWGLGVHGPWQTRWVPWARVAEVEVQADHLRIVRHDGDTLRVNLLAPSEAGAAIAAARSAERVAVPTEAAEERLFGDPQLERIGALVDCGSNWKRGASARVGLGERLALAVSGTVVVGALSFMTLGVLLGFLGVDFEYVVLGGGVAPGLVGMMVWQVSLAGWRWCVFVGERGIVRVWLRNGRIERAEAVEFAEVRDHRVVRSYGARSKRVTREAVWGVAGGPTVELVDQVHESSGTWEDPTAHRLLESAVAAWEAYEARER